MNAQLSRVAITWSRDDGGDVIGAPNAGFLQTDATLRHRFKIDFVFVLGAASFLLSACAVDRRQP